MRITEAIIPLEKTLKGPNRLVTVDLGAKIKQSMLTCLYFSNSQEFALCSFNFFCNTNCDIAQVVLQCGWSANA